MPYFIYRVSTPQPEEKILEYLEEHSAFIDAKKSARAMRAGIPATASYTIRIMFAADQHEAETLLTTKQEAPILKEWEK